MNERYLTILNPWNGSQAVGNESVIPEGIERLQVDDRVSSDDSSQNCESRMASYHCLFREFFLFFV